MARKKICKQIIRLPKTLIKILVKSKPIKPIKPKASKA